MKLEEINIGDIVRSGFFGYKVLGKNVQENIVCVRTTYVFKDRSCRTIVETRKNGETYIVEPSCFECKYVTKAVIL